MNTVGIIPARFAATRLPGKPLRDISGRPMIQHVYERALSARSLGDLIVATDDERIMAVVRGFGGKAVLTSPEHRSGTDRIAEVAAGLDAEVVVNIQGDEPLVDPGHIDELVEAFRRRRSLKMGTLATPIASEEDFHDPAVVKVVFDRRGHALYFSRRPIPFERNGLPAARWKHIGMYAYRRDFLMRFARLAPTPLEKAESLEQLRAMENGVRIFVVRTAHDAISVDTEADLVRVRELMGGK